jgi:hypothetical protein
MMRRYWPDCKGLIAKLAKAKYSAAHAGIRCEADGLLRWAHA